MTAHRLPLPERLGQGLFVGGLLVVALRPLIQENHDTFEIALMNDLGGLQTLSPAITLWIALINVIIFGATMALRACGYLTAPRRTGILVGLAIISIAAVWQCGAASNQRLAITASIDWIATPLLAVALAHLMQRAWQMRLACCVIVATGAAAAVECYDQVWSTLPETIVTYENHKAEQWGRQGIPLDDYRVELFERRLYEKAANGPFAFANVTGSYLVVVAFTVLAGLRRGSTAVVTVGLAAMVTCAVWLTGSRGATAVLLIGLTIAAFAWSWRAWINRHREQVWRWSLVTVLTGISAIAATAWVRGGLPGGSLTYRWWYLESTARMVAEHPFGVGTGQFGRYYTRYKEIKSPEEIAHPHNFIAAATAAWGVPGFVGIVLMVIGGSRAVTGLGRREESPHDDVFDQGGSGPQFTWFVASGAIGCAVLFGARGLLHYENLHLAIGANVLTCPAWFLGFILTAWSSEWRRPPSTPWLVAGISAFLMHNLITFALAISGAATTFFAMFAIAVACAARTSEATAPRSPGNRRLATAIIASTVFAGAAIAYWGIAPLQRSWPALCQARTAMSFGDASRSYEAAMGADLRDPTAPYELLRLQIAVGRPTAKVLDAVAIRDPESTATYRLMAQAMVQSAPPDPQQAANIYEEVLKRYPTNPDDHLRMADILMLVYEQAHSADVRQRAHAELTQALQLDAARDPLEVRRYSAEKRAKLAKRLQVLESKAAKPTPG